MRGSILWVGPDGVARFTPRRVDVTPHDLIACPTCLARVDQCCRSTGGNRVAAHIARLAPRLCPCGQVPRPTCTYCDRCRALIVKRSRARHRQSQLARRVAA